MIVPSTTPSLLDNSAASQFNNQEKKKQRLNCLACNHQVDPNDESAFVTFSCNVRGFKDESFKVWRCPDCMTIHCLDVVDLPHYYAKYPIAQATLTWPYRFCYGNLYRQLTKHGFSQAHSFLDYGCASGMFIQYLRQRGFANCYGYEPYAPKEGFGNPATLQRGSFDYILLQDVIEHIEDPNALLRDLDGLLTPGGYILIGTPNAAQIDLNQPNVSDYYNEVHVPYHLHLYTPASLESLGCRQGWEPVDFFDRPYHDTPWFSVNTRAWNEYQRLFDGTIDVVYEQSKPWKTLTSYRYLFYALFGYWLSFRTGMAIMFHKSGV
jgi:SAM-dependent methyltransferase